MPVKLNEKERRIVEFVARGRTNREVADRLELSHKTIEWTLTRVYKRLHVRSRTELAAKLAAAWWPTPGPEIEASMRRRTTGTEEGTQ